MNDKTRTTTPKRRWRRRVAVILGTVGFLAVVLVLIVGSAPFARVALRFASQTLEESSGYSLEAEVLRLHPLRGALDAQHLRVLYDGRPVVAAEAVEANLDLLPLLRSKVAVKSVLVRGLELDLEAPRPEPRAAEAEPSNGAFEIRSLRVQDARVRMPPVSGVGLEEWQIEQLELSGSYLEEQLELRTRAVVALLKSRFESRRDFDLEVALEATADRIDVAALELTGDGFSLNGQGDVELSGDSATLPRVRASFDLAADSERLFDQPDAGPLAASGSIDTGGWTGELKLRGERLPAALLAHLDGDTLAALELETASLDVEAHFERSPGEPATGDASWLWRRGQEPLFTGTARLDSAEIDAAGRPDLRSVAGAATVRSESMPFEVVKPLLRLAGLGELDAVGRRSRFDIDARLSASPSEPQPWSVDGDLGWRLESGASLRTHATSLRAAVTEATVDPLTVEGGITITARSLPLGLLKPWLDGEGLDQAGAQTSVDLDLETVVDLSAQRPLEGEAKLQWRQGTQTLAEIDATAARSAVTTDGRLDLEQVEIGLELDARDLAMRRWLPFLPEPLASDFPELRDTTVTAALSARALPFRPALRSGSAHAHIARGEEHWVDLEAHVLEDAPGLAVTSVILPADPGRRRVDAEIVAASWASFLEGTWRRGELSLDTPSLRDSLAAIAQRWPDRLTEPPSHWPLDSSFDARIELAGSLLEPQLTLEALLEPQSGGQLQATASGDVRRLRGEAELRLKSLSLAQLGPLLKRSIDGHADGVLHVTKESDGTTLERFAGRLELTVDDLVFENLENTSVRLTALTDGRTLRLEQLEARQANRRLAAAGELALAVIPEWAELQVTLNDPDSGLGEIESAVTVDHQALRVESRRWETTRGSGRFLATAPLATLARLPGLDPSLAEPLLTRSDGGAAEPLRLEAEIPRYSEIFNSQEEPLAIDLEGVHIALEVDPAVLSETHGSVAVQRLALEYRGHALRNTSPIRVELDEERLRLASVTFSSPRDQIQQIELAAQAHLRSGWGPEDAANAIETVEIAAQGTFELDLLDPLLLGGVGSGPLTLDARLSGPTDALSGSIALSGPEARVDFSSPYRSRFENFAATVDIVPGRTTLQEATARLNEGGLRLEGALLTPEGTNLRARFDGVRYRLDYGLSALLGGDLRILVPAEDSEQRAKLEGELVVERGLVRRDIDLERELLSRLFAPTTPSGSTGESEPIDLDLRLTTREGVRVRNNVADLRAIWSPISVRGTLDAPTFDGVVAVEPGGRVFAYGQTLRLDRASMQLSSLPGAEPRIELVTTSSLEDPTISRQDSGPSLDPFARSSASSGAETRSAQLEALGTGFADYLGARLGAGLERALGSTLGEITIRPVVVLGESDPDARLTVGREVTDRLDLAISLNMRSAERRTYLLHLHDLPLAPTVQAQLFTNEESHEGATLQQRLEAGGGPLDERPRLRRIRFSIQEANDPESAETVSVDTKALRRAIGLDRNEPLPDGFLFDAEIDVTEALRRRGHSAPQVEVEAVPASKNRLDIAVEIEPGPRTEVEWRGVEPAPNWRRSIASLYRSDLYEEASLEEMRQYTVRSLRSAGYLDPQVTVDIDKPAGAQAAKRVIVTSEGGRRLDLGPVRFSNVADDELERLQERFVTTLARVELAAAAEAADRSLMTTLASLGYKRASISGRSIGPQGKILTVDLDLGKPQTIERVEIEGVEDEEKERFRSLIDLEPGQVARSNRLAVAAYTIEEDLRQQGYNDARTRVFLRDEEAERAVVVLHVEPGKILRVHEVTVEGLRATHPKWAAALAGVAEGSTLESRELVDVRRRYFESGLFSTVSADLERDADGLGRLAVDVEERPRLSLAYGLRWESEEGGGIVVDLLDRNALGRGVALGARMLYTDDRQVARLYGTAPRLFGSRYTLESFLEAREENDSGFLTDTSEASLQLSRPFKRRGTGRVYARYRSQRFTEEDPDPFFPLDVTVNSPFLGVQYIYDRRTDPLSGKAGLFASVDLSGSDEAIGSDFRYLRLFGQVNLYRPIGRIGRRQLGWSQSVRIGLADPFGQILLRDLRFFAGGEYSVRGYPAEGIGPQESFGDIDRALGGEALFVLNQELHIPLWGRFRGVAFFDAGNVWEEIDTIDSELEKSVGLGLRVQSPAGLLRLDIAFPLDRQEGEDTRRIYLGFGQVF